MKLEDAKQSIDNYLDSVSAEDLLSQLTTKYGMEQYDLNDTDNIPDEKMVGDSMIA